MSHPLLSNWEAQEHILALEMIILPIEILIIVKRNLCPTYYTRKVGYRRAAIVRRFQ